MVTTAAALNGQQLPSATIIPISIAADVVVKEPDTKMDIEVAPSSTVQEGGLKVGNTEANADKVEKVSTVLVVALITILSLLSLSLYKNNSVRARANELLTLRNAELERAKESVERASLIKEQFLSTITHELRTPMYAVTGLTHLLLSEDPTPQQKAHLDSLKFSGEYLLSLINNILDLNKLEANKVEVEQVAFDLRKRVDDVIFALERSVKERGNLMKVEIDETVPHELIGDPLMISQVLINLVGNGNKFTRDGLITLRINKAKLDGEAVFLRFEIEDNGEGISKKKQEDIFENFTQGSLQINRKYGGTGLGLSIVKRLLELNNSKIKLESTLGQGSKFYFNIRYGYTDTKDGEREQAEQQEVDYSILDGRKILVVEDNKINQMITRKILNKKNITCDLADNGTTGVDYARENDYDLVLMDIHMPGISGMEATVQIREFDKNLPIIALTAVAINQDSHKFYEAGFNDIIPKPYEIDEFFEKIVYNISAYRKVGNVS